MPVLPLVGSSSVVPGWIRPSFSAISIIFRAGRSLIEPVGLRSSSFAHNRTSGLGDSRGRPTRGVLPTEARRSSYRVTGLRSRRLYPGAGSAGHGGQHDDLVAVAQRGLQTTEEADVLVVDVDVDETSQVFAAVLGLEQPLLDPGVARLEVVDELGQARAAAGHGLVAAGVGAQDGRDPDLDGHRDAPVLS